MKRLYETIFIINPDSDDATIEQTIGAVRSLIESNGYEVKRVDPWGKRRLAYEVKRHRDGYYVLMVFEAETQFVEQLQRHYRITEPIIKYIVVIFEGDPTQFTPQKEEKEAVGEVEEVEAEAKDQE